MAAAESLGRRLRNRVYVPPGLYAPASPKARRRLGPAPMDQDRDRPGLPLDPPFGEVTQPFSTLSGSEPFPHIPFSRGLSDRQVSAEAPWPASSTPSTVSTLSAPPSGSAPRQAQGSRRPWPGRSGTTRQRRPTPRLRPPPVRPPRRRVPPMSAPSRPPRDPARPRSRRPAPC